MIAGLPAMFSAMVLPFDAALALPWAAVSWPLASLGGYQIWRAQHPTTSAVTEISRRGRGVLGVVATAVAVTLGELFPEFVLLIVGLWAAAVALGFLFLGLAGREEST